MLDFPAPAPTADHAEAFKSGVRAVWESLGSEGQAGVRAYRKARREATAAKRKARHERAGRIFELYFAGRTSEEIAAELGDRSARAVRHFAFVRGVTISRAPTFALLLDVSLRRRAALERLAADLETTPAKVLGGFLTLALDDDAAIGRGVLRVPRREGVSA